MKKTQHCSSMEEISQYYSARDRTVLGGHFESCPRCAKIWDELDAIRGAALDAPSYTPSAAQAAEIEAQVLSHALRVPSPALRRRRRFAVPIAAAVAAAAVMFVVSSRDVQPHSARSARSGSVEAKAGTDFEHFTRFESDQTEAEIVRVRAGRVHLDVNKLAKNKTFKVVTANGEVEVWGTSFDVDVKEDRLMAVTVSEGVVALRVPGQAERVLRAGDSWRRPVAAPEAEAAMPPQPEAVALAEAPAAEPLEPTEAPATAEPARSLAAQKSKPAHVQPQAPASPVKAPPAPQPRAADDDDAPKSEELQVADASPRQAEPAEEAPQAPLPQWDEQTPGIPPPGEAAFAAGWTALKNGDSETAAARFAEAARLSQGKALAEDASYWHAVALARAAKSEAKGVMTRFVETYPEGERAPEVWVMLGWQHLKDGERRRAQTAFETALKRGGPEVELAAQRGLARLR